MRQAVISAGLLLAALMLAGCEYGVAQPQMVSDPLLAKANLHYYWKVPVRLAPGESVLRLWRLDETAYALTSCNRLVAVNAVCGTYKWSYQLSGPVENVYGPINVDNLQLPAGGGIVNIVTPPDRAKIKPVDTVVITTLGYFAVLNRETGEEIRKLPFDFPANTAAASDGTYLYVGDLSGLYYAIRLVDGYPYWKMSTGDTVVARPHYYNRRLYVASKDGLFRLLNPEPQDSAARKPITFKTDGPLTAGFHVDARGCFVPSEDYNLYAYDLGLFNELWVFRTQGPLRQAVQVGKRSCFQYADRDRFYCIDLAKGTARWESPDARLVVGATDCDAMVLTATGQLQIVDESTGKINATLPMTGLSLFAANADKPVIYAVTRGGLFVCIRPIDAPALTADMLEGETTAPIMPVAPIAPAAPAAPAEPVPAPAPAPTPPPAPTPAG